MSFQKQYPHNQLSAVFKETVSTLESRNVPVKMKCFRYCHYRDYHHFQRAPWTQHTHTHTHHKRKHLFTGQKETQQHQRTRLLLLLHQAELLGSWLVMLTSAGRPAEVQLLYEHKSSTMCNALLTAVINKNKRKLTEICFKFTVSLNNLLLFCSVFAGYRNTRFTVQFVRFD